MSLLAGDVSCLVSDSRCGMCLQFQTGLFVQLVQVCIYILQIRIHRVFASCMCPVCSGRGRTIAYCEVGK